MKKFFKCFPVVIISILIAFGKFSGDGYAENANKGYDSNVDEKPTTYHVVGESKAIGAFSSRMKQVSEAMDPLDEGRLLYKSGKYKEAAEKYEMSLDLHQKYKVLEWLPRWRLSEAYEALGDKKNALEQIDWLIEHCRNKDTLKQLQLRKQNLLK